MKKIALIALTASLFLFVTGGVSAKVISSPNGTVTIAKDEVVDDDLFVGGQNVTIDGTVNGDVYVGAQTVKINGTVNGNLHAGGQTVALGGTVKNSAYIGAQDITVSQANIGDSLLAGGQNISVDRTTTIGGSLLLGGASVAVDSTIQRSVYVGAAQLALGPNTTIGKDLYYSAEKDQSHIDKSAKISGEIHKSEFQATQKNTQVARRQMRAVLGTIRLFGWIVSFVGALIVGFIYLKLSGRNLEKNTNVLASSLWLCLGVGFLITIAFVPGILILLTTVIGIPLAGLAVLFMFLYWYLAKIVVGSALGSWMANVARWKLSPFWTFVLGLFAIYVLKLIPFIGFLTGLAVFWFGLGAQALTLLSKGDPEK